ncbi:MAG: response regulator, partial [Gammaproteobacteria bacterium]|nr:response regulator [Gammaproteobacteria bacterium]NIX02654.1 response regulator [Phycisphaerae bacterium]
MDINMPDMDGITATQQLTKRVPFSQVIMISVQSDPEYMKQAMIAGARDYQPKPFSAEELISCIRRVYEIGQPVYQRFSTARVAESQVAGSDQITEDVTGQKGLAIAIYSPKGGVGTSTIAANLAAVLQKVEGNIALMDADLQFGDILVHLNTHDSRNICNLIQGDEFDLELLPDVLVPHKTGLKLLLAPPKPEMAELIKPAMITQVIDELRNRFKIVVIDTQNLLTDQTLAVLDSADQIFIVTVPELPAIKSVKLFLDLGHELNLAAKRMSLILNKVDQFGGIPLKQIEGALKLPKTYQIPHDSTVYTNINSGKVITEQRSNTPFVQAMVHLAQATKQELAEAQAALEAETA